VCINQVGVRPGDWIGTEKVRHRKTKKFIDTFRIAHLGGAALDVQPSLLGGSSKGGRLIFDDCVCRRFDGDPEKNRFAWLGLEHLRFACSLGDIERASRLMARMSRIGLGEREC
jgi:hypothetical protein